MSFLSRAAMGILTGRQTAEAEQRQQEEAERLRARQERQDQLETERIAKAKVEEQTRLSRDQANRTAHGALMTEFGDEFKDIPYTDEADYAGELVKRRGMKATEEYLVKQGYNPERARGIVRYKIDTEAEKDRAEQRRLLKEQRLQLEGDRARKRAADQYEAEATVAAANNRGLKLPMFIQRMGMADQARGSKSPLTPAERSSIAISAWKAINEPKAGARRGGITLSNGTTLDLGSGDAAGSAAEPAGDEEAAALEAMKGIATDLADKLGRMPTTAEIEAEYRARIGG